MNSMHLASTLAKLLNAMHAESQPDIHTRACASRSSPVSSDGGKKASEFGPLAEGTDWPEKNPHRGCVPMIVHSSLMYIAFVIAVSASARVGIRLA
jgi:hypothetical protein